MHYADGKILKDIGDLYSSSIDRLFLKLFSNWTTGLFSPAFDTILLTYYSKRRLKSTAGLRAGGARHLLKPGTGKKKTCADF
jgi:hypothetical protein